MGDRVSIAFRNDGEDSVALFHHWGGREFPQVALDYAKGLKEAMSKQDPQGVHPLGRLEPRVVMVDFMRHLREVGESKGSTYNDKMQYVKTGFACDSIYFGKDEHDGDNSDNGHWVIDLSKLEFVHTRGEYEPESEV